MARFRVRASARDRLRVRVRVRLRLRVGARVMDGHYHGHLFAASARCGERRSRLEAGHLREGVGAEGSLGVGVGSGLG